jgi:hypothetical protein
VDRFVNRSSSNDVDFGERGLIYLADRFDILEAAPVTRTGSFIRHSRLPQTDEKSGFV